MEHTDTGATLITRTGSAAFALFKFHTGFSISIHDSICKQANLFKDDQCIPLSGQGKSLAVEMKSP